MIRGKLYEKEVNIPVDTPNDREQHKTWVIYGNNQYKENQPNLYRDNHGVGSSIILFFSKRNALAAIDRVNNGIQPKQWKEFCL